MLFVILSKFEKIMFDVLYDFIKYHYNMKRFFGSMCPLVHVLIFEEITCVHFWVRSGLCHISVYISILLGLIPRACKVMYQ